MDKYQPSNGTEGMIFMSKFCDHCIHQHPDPDHPSQCQLIMLSMAYNVKHPQYPEEWTYDKEGKPTCTKYKRWDWGRDDDGNWIEPPPVYPDDPNQLCLPFIFEEIGIKKQQHEHQESHSY